MVHATTSIMGCGSDMEVFARDTGAYIKRSIQCNQNVVAKSLVILVRIVSAESNFCLLSQHALTFSNLFFVLKQQLAFELMGSEANAFDLYLPGLIEERLYATSIEENTVGMCRLICLKRLHVAFWTGDMKLASEQYDLSQTFTHGNSSRLYSTIVR
jgi:hypothetical protein